MTASQLLHCEGDVRLVCALRAWCSGNVIRLQNVKSTPAGDPEGRTAPEKIEDGRLYQ